MYKVEEKKYQQIGYDQRVLQKGLLYCYKHKKKRRRREKKNAKKNCFEYKLASL